MEDTDKSLLEQQAQAQSKLGMQAYSRWWHSAAITPEERKYLMDNNFHQTNKEIAADVDKKGT